MQQAASFNEAPFFVSVFKIRKEDLAGARLNLFSIGKFC